MKRLFLSVALATMVCACATHRENMAGAKILGYDGQMDDVDFVHLLTPQATLNANKAAGASAKSSKKSPDDRETAIAIQRAFQDFYDAPPADWVRRRNDVQWQLMAASEQRCATWKAFVLKSVSDVGFSLGGLAALFSGGAAAFRDEETIRALAASAGATNAIRTEYQKSYLFDLTVHVAFEAIDKRRARLKEKINGHVQDTIAKYPMAQAVSDALEYHAACSMAAGVSEASESIKEAANPGVNTVVDAMRKFGLSTTFIAQTKAIPATDENKPPANDKPPAN